MKLSALNFYFDYAIQRLQVTIILSKIDNRRIMVIFSCENLNTKRAAEKSKDQRMRIMITIMKAFDEFLYR